MHLLETAARWAWETSVAASILTIPALLAALFLRKPIFTPIRHLLGLLIVARLLLPFAFPSPLSIFNLIDREAWSAAIVRPFGFQRPSPAPTLSFATTKDIETPPQITNSPIPQINPRAKQIAFLPSIWTIGVLATVIRVALQHIRIRRYTRCSNEITSGPVLVALCSALELSRCRRNIKIYSIPNLSTPALFGLFRPSILLPGDLAQSNDHTRLRLVCLHEVAHLKRFDLLINWLMIFAQTLHWFNPLVWLAMRRLRADQELLCDADVMRILHPDEQRTYGETLLALASEPNYTLSTLIPVSSSFKQLKERIAMIKQFKAAPRVLVFALPLLAALLALVTFTGAANKRPAPPTAEKKNTATDADKADRKIEALQVEFSNETLRVQGLEKQIDDLRKALKIYDAGDGIPLTLEPETVRRIEQDRIRVQQEYVQFNNLYNTLKSKTRAEMRQMIPTANRDEVLDRLLDKLVQTEQQLVVMQKDYSDEHPEVVRPVALIKELNKQIEARIDGILEGLKALVDARKAIVDELTAQLDAAKKIDAGNMENFRPYFRAKRDLETHEKFRDALYLRLLEAKAERAIGH